MPTLMPSAPRSIRNRAPSAVAMLPGDHLDVAEALSEFRDRALHHDRVAVRDVDDDDVDPGANELRRALQIVAGRADRGADAQPALASRVANGMRRWLHEIARGDQAEQPAVGVDERQLLDLALHHQPLRRVRRRAGR